MSNYLSQEYRIQAPQSNVDVALVDKTLTTLDNKYDANEAAIQQVLATYNTKLQTLRPGDNAYIASKLKEVTSVIDQYRQKNGNLAYNYNKDSLLSAATSVIQDPIVADAIQSTQNYQNYNNQVEELKKKNPKLYSDANYQYALYNSGFQDYMSGKSKKLGQIQYSPYVDLTEENLKKLKTIKEVSGKRFVEIQDPNNPGQIIRKEIDGLEDWQINQYLGSTMSAPELNQMRIQAWAKNGGNSIETNRTNIVAQYDDYRNQKTTYLENQKAVNDQIINNSSYSDNQRDEAKRKSESLTEQINGLKAMNPAVLDTTTIASTLERANYLNGISQLAKSEWSSEFKKNDVYFANQALDIDKQRLDIAQQNLGLAQAKLGLEQAKFAQKQGIDPTTGQPITTGVVSQTPMSSELAGVISAEAAGQGTLEKEHNQAYNNVMREASTFISTGTEEDVNTLKAELNLRGVEVIGNQFKFKNPSANVNNSLANTVYESFKKTNNTTPEMYKNNEIKKQKSAELLTVRKEALPKVFNEDPDTYINSLKAMIAGKKTGQLVDYFDAVTGRPISSDVEWDQAVKAEEYVKRNGGWSGLKTNLQRDPQKLLEFSEILSEMTSNAYKASDLKKDARAEIEKTIQTKTASGVMMSAYNQFNLVNDKIKESVLKSVVGEEVVFADSGQQANTDFDPKQNVTIRKSGDDVYVEQYKVSGSGDKEKAVPIKYKVNRASSLYGELSKYIDLEGSKNTGYIQATKDTKIDPMKVSIPSFATSRTGQQTQAYKVETTMPAEAKKAFGIVNFQPGRLATKELAAEEITARLTSFGIPKEKVELYKNTVLSNLAAYQIKTVVKPNPAAGFRNEFAMEILDNTGKRISDSFLGTDKLSYDMKYTMEMFPQVYVLNQLLYSASVNRNNIDEEINKL